MPRPLRTCAFGASSKTAYYSLSACYSKLFDSPEQLGSSFDSILMIMLVEPLGEIPSGQVSTIHVHVCEKQEEITSKQENY